MKGNLIIYMASIAQLVAYGGIHYFVRSKYAGIEASTPFRTLWFVLYCAPVLGLLATELITPYSMAKSSMTLLHDYFIL